MIKWAKIGDVKDGDDVHESMFKHIHINDIPKIIVNGKMTIVFENMEIQFCCLESDEQSDNLNKGKPENV